ncbi:MAG: NAD(P)-dependent oxidoreductase, partial [Candidatus Adiutrix sp.]|nr:NAD(P)-dependent oxidoreductase [Candidatus Adiutrix sp.]
MKVGFIGLGAMGGNMAKNLRKAGLDLVVTDISAVAVKELTDLGAEAKTVAAEVAAVSDVVCSSLPNSAILKNVALGDEGVLSALRPGSLHIDFSSVEPALVRELADKYKEKGCGFVDAPVSGGMSGAEAGTLTVMVGAEAGDFAKAKPIMEHIGTKIIHMGGVGNGQSMKLVNNLLLGANMVAVAEALTLGARLGLSPRVMYDTIRQSSGASYALEAKAGNFILKGNFTPGFAVDLQYKDLEL